MSRTAPHSAVKQWLVPVLQLLQTENVHSKNCAVSQFYKTITSLLQPAAGSSGVFLLWNIERMMFSFIIGHRATQATGE